MKDDYDKGFEYLQFNCALIKSMKWQFFNASMNPEAERAVLHHLLKCRACLKVYEDYAQEIGYGAFDILNCLEDFNKRMTERQLAKPPEVGVYMKAWRDENIVKLGRSKAIRQVMLSGEKDYEFCRYLIKEIAEDLDYLEICYLKEYEGEVKDEKS